MPPLATRLALLCALLLGGSPACAGPNLWTDLGSVSTDKSNRGRLRSPARLPLRGSGFRVPKRWQERGFQYGTDELVAAVQRAAARVHAADRRATLGVADFSRNRGGSSKWHNSHHSGRDVDIIFYTTDAGGKPLPPQDLDMMTFDDDGKPYVGKRDKDGYHDPAWAVRRFDVRRNWEFIEALLTDPSIRLQWVFVSDGLKAKLLAWARRKQRPQWVIAYADMVLRQPADSLPHDNHFHVRVYCSRADRFHGCVDRGPVWQHEKKTFKYDGPGALRSGDVASPRERGAGVVAHGLLALTRRASMG
ncbi:MAG: penicillin-insensitive murein endopeptidase [Deltaproteobacteria bacterium]|nr:penicillin-insensitive murein endopeptidase [Deltaproteobacteria bacterium]